MHPYSLNTITVLLVSVHDNVSEVLFRIALLRIFIIFKLYIILVKSSHQIPI